MSRIVKVGGPIHGYSVIDERQLIYELDEHFKMCFKDIVEGSSDNLVVVTPQATSDIMNCFTWGKAHPLNIYEQQAGLVGHVFKTNGSRSKFIVVVEYVVPMFSAERNAVGASMESDDLARMRKEIDVINANSKRSEHSILQKYGSYILLGIVHSHPNGLDVFVSGTDQNTHRKRYANRDGFGLSMVINPHRRLKVVYGGPDVIKTKCVYYVFPEDYERWTGEKNNYQENDKGNLGVELKLEKDVISERELQEKLNHKKVVDKSKSINEDNVQIDMSKESDAIICRKNMLEIKKSKRKDNVYEVIVNAPSYVGGILKPHYDDGPFKFIYEVDMDGKVLYIKALSHIAHPLVDKKGYLVNVDSVNNPVSALQHILNILSFEPKYIPKIGKRFEKWYQKKYDKGDIPTFSFAISETKGEKQDN